MKVGVPKRAEGPVICPGQAEGLVVISSRHAKGQRPGRLCSSDFCYAAHVSSESGHAASLRATGLPVLLPVIACTPHRRTSGYPKLNARFVHISTRGPMAGPSALEASGGFHSQAFSLGWANCWGFAPLAMVRDRRSCRWRALSPIQCRFGGIKRDKGGGHHER